MQEDVFNILVVLTILTFAVVLWIAAWMDTDTGVYPSPDTTTPSPFSTVEIDRALVCDPDCRYLP